MRLTQSQQSSIRQTVDAVAGSGVRVWLFGSRVDDTAKGGDIDLMVEMPVDVASSVLLSARIGARLQMALGDQRIDVLIAAPNLPELTIHRIARETGIAL